MSEFILKSDFDDAFEEAFNRKVENTYFNGENIPIVENRENTDWNTSFNPAADIRHAMQLFDEPMQELRIVYTPQMYDALVVLNGGIPFYLINHQVIKVL